VSRAALTAALIGLFWSSSAWACPVCGGGGLNREAFIDTALVLTFLPLILMGGGVYWLFKTYIASDDQAALAARERGRQEAAAELP